MYLRLSRRNPAGSPDRNLTVLDSQTTRMPLRGIRGRALQRRDSGRYHLRFFKNVIFQTGFTGLTGYVFNPVHHVILSNLKCQLPAPEHIAKLLDGVR